MDSEQDKMAKTAHNKIFIAPPMQIDLEKSTPTCSGSRTLPMHNSDEVVDVLQEMVPTYHPPPRARRPHRCGRHRQHRAFLPGGDCAELRETEHPAEEG